MSLCHTEGVFSSSLESYKASNVEDFLPFDQVNVPRFKVSSERDNIVATILSSHNFI